MSLQTDLQNLQRQLVLVPDDKLLRLAYADALEEVGQDRLAQAHRKLAVSGMLEYLHERAGPHSFLDGEARYRHKFMFYEDMDDDLDWDEIDLMEGFDPSVMLPTYWFTWNGNTSGQYISVHFTNPVLLDDVVSDFGF
jgi:uncharacterized protein (TIGR02996 family)